MRKYAAAALGCFLPLSSCTVEPGGTDTGNPPLIDFDESGCKSHQYEKELRSQSLETTSAFENPLYDGLTCFVWQRLEAGSLRVQITNYADSCGADLSWTPEARVVDGELQLALMDTRCIVAGCGSCVYDLSYDVRVDTTSDLAVSLEHEGCGATRKLTARLPLATQEAGSSCVYADHGALFWHAGTTGSLGKRHMPCVTSPKDGPSQQCDDGLVCSAPSPERPICLARCTSDAECDALTRCSDGVCQLHTTGVTIE